MQHTYIRNNWDLISFIFINVDTDGGGTFEVIQKITLPGVGLTVGGSLTDQQIPDGLLTNGNMIVD
jgi:hypothetical protein